MKRIAEKIILLTTFVSLFMACSQGEYPKLLWEE